MASAQHLQTESNADAEAGAPTRSMGLPLNSFFFGSMPAQPNAAQGLASPARIRSSWWSEVRMQSRRLRMFHDTEDNQYWPEIFGTSPWFPQVSPWLLFIRLAVACLFIIVWIYSLIRYFNDGYWFIYLTHWSLTIETLYFCFATYTTYAALQVIKKRRTSLFDRGAANPEAANSNLPRFVKITWVLLHIAMPAAWMVMLMYWTAVNPIWKPKTTPDLLTCFVHGINFVFMLVDLFLSRNVFYLPHVWWFFAYMTTYGIWTVIHYWWGIGVADGCSDQDGSVRFGRQCPIYGIVDWTKPSMTGVLALIVLLCIVPMCQFPIWWCIRARRTADYFNTNARQTRVAMTTQEQAPTNP